MSTDQGRGLAMWWLTWNPQAGERGRKHVSMFVTIIDSAESRPLDSEQCIGTSYQVRGSPYTGFALEISRDWNTAASTRLESATKIGSIDSSHVWQSEDGILNEDDQHERCGLDKVAHRTRPPGVSKDFTNADAILDCQDWCLWLIEGLVQQKMVEPEVLQVATDAMYERTVLATQGSTRVLTASLARPLSSQPQTLYPWQEELQRRKQQQQ